MCYLYLYLHIKNLFSELRQLALSRSSFPLFETVFFLESVFVRRLF